MSIAASQARTFRRQLEALRPHWRSDRALPDRIERLLREDRRLGARDRRLYRELIYTTLRYLPWIEPALEGRAGSPAPSRDLSRSGAEACIAWLSAETPATAAFRAALTAGWPPCPDSVAAKAGHLGADPDAVLPGWLRSECPEAFAPRERDALCARAPLWIRLQTADPAAVLAEFDSLGWTWRRSPALPGAIRLEGNPKIAESESFQRGRFEIQDIGSQAILASTSIAGRWLDACAGAGGKTLQLAWLLGPNGQVDAHDIRPDALAVLRERAARQGKAPNAEPSSDAPSERGGTRQRFAGPAPISVPPTLAPSYDGILVDAPCSGSGTWRRHPHLKWTTGPASLATYADRQLALLSQFAPRVRAGGRLIYATCSLCRSENEAVAEGFLASHPGFQADPVGGIRFRPSALDGDGFYALFMQNTAPSA